MPYPKAQIGPELQQCIDKQDETHAVDSGLIRCVWCYELIPEDEIVDETCQGEPLCAGCTDDYRAECLLERLENEGVRQCHEEDDDAL